MDKQGHNPCTMWNDIFVLKDFYSNEDKINDSLCNRT